MHTNTLLLTLCLAVFYGLIAADVYSPSDRIAAPHPRSAIQHELRENEGIITKLRVTGSVDWRRAHSPVHARVKHDTVYPFILALAHQHVNTIEKVFWEVASPSSPSYGVYPSIDDIRVLASSSSTSLSLVCWWLRSSGVVSLRAVRPRSLATCATNKHTHKHKHSHTHKWPSNKHEQPCLTTHGDFLVLPLSIADAELLFNTTYHIYTNERGQQIWRCEHYSYHMNLQGHLDFASPTLHFPSSLHSASQRHHTAATATRPHAQHITQHQLVDTDRPACSPFVDITCLNWLYSTENYIAVEGTNTSVCATGFDGEYIDAPDVYDFLQWFAPGNAHMSVDVIGPNNSDDPGGEALQDVQLLLGLASNANIAFWSTDGSEPHGPNAAEPFLKFLIDATSSTYVPYVFTTSYGDDELQLDMDYLNRMNEHFQLLALRGVSMLFASGDGGVAGGHGLNCTNFVAVWPSASPYVTAVGGTQLVTPTSNESAAAFSSGGFSNYWAQPIYQQQAVNTYLSSAPDLPASSLFNSSGRAFPDVSAMSYNLPTVTHQAEWPTMGTSCSSPIWAAMIALLNDVRFQNNQSSLGFLNPWLYSVGSNMLNDVTSGSNPGCNTNGFTATQGWDPVTGFGTPNLVSMSQHMPNSHRNRQSAH